MSEIRRIIEETLQGPKNVNRITKFGLTELTPREKVSIRAMMSRYWDDPVTFGLNIAGAIVQQSRFMEKMHKIDWLYSPAVESTMLNLVAKYYNFFVLISKSPESLAFLLWMLIWLGIPIN